MELKLVESGHAVGESNYHIQLTPAYRRSIFADSDVAELTLAYILEKLAELRVVVLGYGFGPDHLHIFLANVRFVSEIELVRQIKGYSSYMMRKNFKSLIKSKLWGEKFWSEGHFYRSVGVVNAATMKHYIEEQDKHWEKIKLSDVRLSMQKKIEDY